MNSELIQSDPAVMVGKPVVAGTRIAVELILEKLSAGETVDEILDAHPRLTREGVLAALSFAARALRADFPYRTAWAGQTNLQRLRPSNCHAALAKWSNLPCWTTYKSSKSGTVGSGSYPANRLGGGRQSQSNWWYPAQRATVCSAHTVYPTRWASRS